MIAQCGYSWQLASMSRAPSDSRPAPAVATVILGVFAGRWIRSDRPPAEKTVWLFLAGNAGLLLGVAWAAAFPFVLFGVNAIAAFFLSGIFARVLGLVTWTGTGGEAVTLKGWLHQTLFASWLPPHDASLAFAISFVLLWMGVMWAFWRRNVFIKV
jgi:predicted acyltransferase